MRSPVCQGGCPLGRIVERLRWHALAQNNLENAWGEDGPTFAMVCFLEPLENCMEANLNIKKNDKMIRQFEDVNRKRENTRTIDRRFHCD